MKRNREEIKCYWSGFKKGLKFHAWWKEGVQYVVKGKTLKRAEKEADRCMEVELCLLEGIGK